MILASNEPFKIGEHCDTIENTRTGGITTQPVVIIRKSTIQEYENYWKEVWEMEGLRWPGLSLPNDIRYFYEVSTD